MFKNNYNLGIDFGSSNIKVVEGKYSKKGMVINKCFTIDLSRDLYRNGEILNIHKLSKALEEGLKANKIYNGKVNGVVNSSNIITRLISLPNISYDEIKSMLNYQVEEYIPISSEEYIVQFISLDSFYDEGIEKLNLLLVGVPKVLIESHLKLLENLDLKAEVLDFQPNSISKLIGSSDLINNKYPLKERNIASLDIGYKTTKLTLIEDGLIRLSRVIDFGLLNILNSISLDKGITMEEAEELFLNVENLEFKEDSKNGTENIIRHEISNLIEKIQMIFRYYVSQAAQNSIDLILLQGGLSQLEGLTDIIKEELGITTEKLERLDQLDFKGPLWNYSNAIGSLIRKESKK